MDQTSSMKDQSGKTSQEQASIQSMPHSKPGWTSEEVRQLLLLVGTHLNINLSSKKTLLRK